jgi:hypothetical protein
MEDAGLAFRATKDLDIVLHIEALTPEFGVTFWSLVEKGGYEIRQASDTGKPVFYRFQKPSDARFPAMLELFCRSPDGGRTPERKHRRGFAALSQRNHVRRLVRSEVRGPQHFAP